jgi:hypothetical protein
MKFFLVLVEPFLVLVALDFSNSVNLLEPPQVCTPFPEHFKLQDASFVRTTRLCNTEPQSINISSDQVQRDVFLQQVWLFSKPAYM